MSEPVQAVIYVIGAIAGIWLVISMSGALPLLMLSRVDLEELPAEEAREWLTKVFSRGFVEPQWLAEQGFEPLSVYKVTSQIADPHMVVWQRDRDRTYLCAYLLLGHAGPTDIVTEFEDGGLTTGASKDGLLVPPRPGHWMQAFSVANVKEQWRHHEEGLKFLQEATGQTASRREVNFPSAFVDAIRAQVAYVRSLPLWFLRIPYWYVVRRYGLFGKPVRKQFERHGGFVSETMHSTRV
jgi:hypothetical protein